MIYRKFINVVVIIKGFVGEMIMILNQYIIIIIIMCIIVGYFAGL